MSVQTVTLPAAAVAVMSTLSLYGLARIIVDLTRSGASPVNVRELYTSADAFMKTHVNPHIQNEPHHLDIEAMHDGYMRRGKEGIAAYLRDGGFSKNESHNDFLTNFIFFPRIEEYHRKFHELTDPEKPVKALT